MITSTNKNTKLFYAFFTQSMFFLFFAFLLFSLQACTSPVSRLQPISIEDVLAEMALEYADTHMQENYSIAEIIGLEKSDFTNMQLGRKIPEYELIDGELVDSPCHRYEIRSNGYVTSTLVIIEPRKTDAIQKPTFQYSVEFADTINALPEQKDYAIVYDRYGAYLMTDTACYLSYQFPPCEWRSTITDYFESTPLRDIEAAITSKHEEIYTINFVPSDSEE